jgi:mono/diheme cytochrome c family protein
MDCAGAEHRRARLAPAVIAGALLLAGAAVAARAAEDGAELYQARCANCHDHPQPGLPPRSQLASHPVEFIVEKLTFGSMAPNALGLTDEQIAAIARWLSEAGRAPP